METLVPHVRIGGRYELSYPLADDDGGCSVWRATDSVLERTVTIRVFLGDVGGLAVDPARAASHVSHPAVLAIYDVGITAEGSFVVTEPEPGPSLADLAAEGPLPAQQAAQVTGDLIGACRAARAAASPPPAVDDHHVWLGSDGQIKVGLGLYGPHRLPATEAEQVHAVGTILYAALTGIEPGGATDGTVRAPRSVDPRIPRGLDRITMRALIEPDRGDADEEGFANLDAFGAALARITHHAPAPDPAPAPAPEEHHSIFRSWMLVPLALVVLTIVVIAGGLVLGKLELGGPLGVRAAPAPSASPTGGGRGDGSGRVPAGGVDVSELDVRQIRSYDPFGDGTEGASRAALAIDGNRSTAWESENYFDGVLNKPGMGLLLDLGNTFLVEKYRMSTETPGFTYEIRVGDDPRVLAKEHRSPNVFKAQPIDRNDLASPVTGRYVLVWVTSVVEDPSGGNRASIGDVSVLGREA